MGVHGWYVTPHFPTTECHFIPVGLNDVIHKYTGQHPTLPTPENIHHLLPYRTMPPIIISLVFRLILLRLPLTRILWLQVCVVSGYSA